MSSRSNVRYAEEVIIEFRAVAGITSRKQEKNPVTVSRNRKAEK